MSNRSRALGAKFKEYRLRRGLTGSQLATQLGCTQSTISKLENGALGVTRDFLLDAANAMEVSADELQTLLAVDMLTRAESRSPSSVPDGLAGRQKAIRRIEGAARHSRHFTTAVIPGLLQSRAYAQIIFAGGPGERATTADISRAIEERIARQLVLDEASKRFQFVICEWAFRNHFCGNFIIREQIEHILKINRANVEVRVLPWSKPTPYLMPVGFSLLDDTIVLVDTLDSFVSYIEPSAICEYRRAFDDAYAASLGGDDAKHWLLGLKREIEIAVS